MIPDYLLVVFDLSQTLEPSNARRRRITDKQFKTLQELPASLVLDGRYCEVVTVRTFFMRDATGYTGVAVVDVKYKDDPGAVQLKMF